MADRGDFLRLPRSTIFGLMQSRILPAFKDSGNRLCQREAINEWIEKQENDLAKQGDQPG